MNGVQTRLKCKPNVKRCKRFVFAAHSPLLHPNTLKTKAIIHFQTDHILTRFVFPPLNTGYTTARVAIGFGMQVYALTSKSHFQLPPEIKKMDLDQLFSECDIVSLHCPLTPETHELVNARRLAMMKPNAILINTGRGPLINEQDLADALNSGKIYAAGVDVLSTEPPRADNPLLTAKNCYITPHIAWATTEARERLMNMAISNLQAYIAGTPENVVNK